MAKETEDVMEKQPCPMCHNSTLTLREAAREIPFFGMCFIFSMDCGSCDYHMADVEVEGDGKPIKHTLTIESEEDLNIRIIKSSTAIIKVPRLVEITPGAISNGYVTNVEGILNRIKKVIESQKDDEDSSIRKKAKNQLKKIQRVIWGRENLILTITDPKGNSAIVSDKVKKG